MSTKPCKKIETFPNPEPRRNYIITMDCPEFTCLCPRTGQPDFAIFEIKYIPNKLCIELKSLKLYLWSYRNEGAFHEAVTNKILTDLTNACKPKWMEINAIFNMRGGITTTITTSIGKQPNNL